ncbi:cysteine proteinase [Acaromyces ingoldii]|uniref:Cysteine proteinase n=1 Tax=Acaromyces ingoldii TaxID=215250 RepID=A0A316YCE0_9BASI|nr:cysteine proteinase [Acaromyces ingoldii]PWN87176.1 cysteine proteinase [Acaromyces ingoldii]
MAGQRRAKKSGRGPAAAGGGGRKGNNNGAERATRSRKGRFANLDDHPEAELRLKRRLKEMNLYAADTKGDGNCLFRALSDQLYGDAAHHYRLRQELCDYIEANPERFRNYIEGSEVESYVHNMRQDHVYGGDKEISAFAFAKQKVVKIIVGGDDFNIQDDIQDGGRTNRERERKERQRRKDQSKVPIGATGAPLTAREQRRIKRGKGKDCDEGKAVQAGPSKLPDGSIVEAYGPVYLAYHKWEHYSSVRKIGGPHTGLPRLTEGNNDILSGANGRRRDDEEEEEEVEEEEGEATDGERLLIEHLQEPIPLRTARFYIRQNEGDWKKALEALEALHLASSPEGSSNVDQSDDGDAQSLDRSGSESADEEHDDDETDYEPDEAIRSRPVPSLDDEAFEARDAVRQRQSRLSLHQRAEERSASVSSREAEAVADALDAERRRSGEQLEDDDHDNMVLDNSHLYFGLSHDPRHGGLPDHLRDWRAASPASVDTAGTHSSADGASTSTRATTDEAHDDGQGSTASTAKSPPTEAGDGVSSKLDAARRSKRPASKDPISLRSPKRRSRSRSPAEMPHDDGETTSAARAIANIRVATGNSTPVHTRSDLELSSSPTSSSSSAGYGLRSKAALASTLPLERRELPKLVALESSQSSSPQHYQHTLTPAPTLLRKRGPGRPRKDGLPPGSLKTGSGAEAAKAPSTAAVASLSDRGP